MESSINTNALCRKNYDVGVKRCFAPYIKILVSGIPIISIIAISTKTIGRVY